MSPPPPNVDMMAATSTAALARVGTGPCCGSVSITTVAASACRVVHTISMMLSQLPLGARRPLPASDRRIDQLDHRRLRATVAAEPNTHDSIVSQADAGWSSGAWLIAELSSRSQRAAWPADVRGARETTRCRSLPVANECHLSLGALGRVVVAYQPGRLRSASNMMEVSSPSACMYVRALRAHIARQRMTARATGCTASVVHVSLPSDPAG